MRGYIIAIALYGTKRLRCLAMIQVYSPEIQRNVLDLYQSKIPVKMIVLCTGVSRSRVYAYINAANLPHQYR